MKLQLMPGIFAVCRLTVDAPWPTGAASESTFFSVTRTRDELSIVCEEVHAPVGAQFEGGWRVLKLEGPLELELTGVLIRILEPLARADINIFTIATFDTDYVLVKASRLAEAIRALAQAGHDVDVR